MITALSPNDEQFVAGVLAGIGDRFAEPSEDIPSTRCVARPTLIRALLDIRDTLAIPGHRRVSGTALLNLLHQSGLACPVPLDQRRPELPHDRLYALGLGIDPQQLDPVELLQSHRPKGVICYFTALQIHGLTTQIPPFHHIASLSDAHPRDPSETIQPSLTVQDIPGTDERFTALGTHEFTFQGIPYYTTNREQRYLPGIQLRYLNDKTRFRLTTLEQTLLDTLHRPNSCGGPPVVFEAWAEGVPRMNPERLAQLLMNVDDSRLTRRIGFMIEQQQGYRIDPLLASVLDRTRVNSLHGQTNDPIALFPAIPVTHIDPRWGVGIP